MDEHTTRATLKSLTLQQWEAVNEVMMRAAIGNRFDARVEERPGGGVSIGFAPRELEMLARVDAIREDYGLSAPAVLDVGCWQGHLMMELLQRGYEVWGADVAESMRAHLNGNMARLTPEDQKRFGGFYAGWIHRLAPSLGQFDIVVCEEVLEHVPESVLAQTCAALKHLTAGTLLASVPGLDDHWPPHLRLWDAEGLAAAFRGPGWEVKVGRMETANYFILEAHRL